MIDKVEAAWPVGRPVLSRLLDLTEYKARVLLEAISEQAPGEAYQRQHLLDLEAQVEMLQKKSAAVEALTEVFSTAVRQLPKLKIDPLPREVDDDLDPEEALVHFSDVHVGAEVSAEQTGGLGSYNFEAFLRRKARAVHALRSILRYTPNPIPRFHVVLGGDIIEGGTIFRGQQRQICLPVVKQVTFAYEHFADLIRTLAEMFPEVVVSCVVGNHGRLGQKGEFAPTDNLDWLLYWFLQERFAGVENVRFNIPDTWWMVLEVNGWKFHVSHGEDFRAWAGIPFYGAQKYKGRLREMLRESFASATGERADFDYLLVGHHHEMADFGNILMNGSWVGGSEFSVKQLQCGGLPYQTLIGVHERQGIAWRRALVLEDRRNLPELTVYS